MKKYKSIIDNIQEKMFAELATIGFSLENPSYKKLSKKLSSQVRKVYENYCNELSLDPNKPLYTRGGIKVATGFERIVIGDYGAYIEYDKIHVPSHIEYTLKSGEEYRLLPEWKCKVKYIWYTIQDTDIKIYWQLRGVTYADYKPYKYYISPFDVIQI